MARIRSFVEFLFASVFLIGAPTLRDHRQCLAAQGAANQDLTQLLQELGSRDPKVRQDAVVALGELSPKDKAVIPVLIKSLLDPNIRGRVEDALEKIGEPAVPELLHALETGNETLRLVVMEALGQMKPIGGKKVEDALLKFVHDPNRKIARFAIAMSTWKAPRPKSLIPVLLDYFRDEKSSDEFRGWLAGSRSNYGPEAGVAPPDLILALKDQKISVDVRCGIARGLAKIGPTDGEVLSTLRNMLQDKKEDLWFRGAG